MAHKNDVRGHHLSRVRAKFLLAFDASVVLAAAVVAPDKYGNFASRAPSIVTLARLFHVPPPLLLPAMSDTCVCV